GGRERGGGRRRAGRGRGRARSGRTAGRRGRRPEGGRGRGRLRDRGRRQEQEDVRGNDDGTDAGLVAVRVTGGDRLRAGAGVRVVTRPAQEGRRGGAAGRRPANHRPTQEPAPRSHAHRGSERGVRGRGRARQAGRGVHPV